MTNEFHIAYIVSHYPHKAFGHDGGLGTSVYNLVERIRRKKIQVSVFVYGQEKEFTVKEENLTVYSIKDSGNEFFKFYFYRKTIEKFINDKINKDKIDILEAPDWTGITAFMNFRIPLVIRFHGSDTYFCHLEKRKQKFKNFWFEKWAIQKAKAFIAPTTFAGEVSKKLFGINNKTIKTIHYGLELDKFENRNPEHYEKGLILYIGTIIRKKGVFELPAIFNKVRHHYPDAQLILIGSDSCDITTKSKSTWQLLQEQFQVDDKHKVFYLDKIPYYEVQEYIKKAHVCVFPTFAETLGMVTIESMALQKPVVNSNMGWAQELIEDGHSGFLVHPKEHQLFADKIGAIFGDIYLMKQLGENARRRAETVFDIEKIADENITFYKSIIAKF